MKIVDRLQQMNNIHITVKESLQVGVNKLFLSRGSVYSVYILHNIQRGAVYTLYTYYTIPTSCSCGYYMKIETKNLCFEIPASCLQKIDLLSHPHFLQQANKKEKNYQEEIEILTKTNHILHYTLEKEKEEKLDLQEMFDVIEHDHKKFKSEQVGKTRDLDKKVEELLEENNKLKELKETLEKQTKDLQVRT